MADGQPGARRLFPAFATIQRSPRPGRAARCASSRIATPPGSAIERPSSRSIIATSLRFGVLCRFTAYVAIDRAAVVNEGGEVHQVTQPVEMPAGWGEARLLSEACMALPMAMSADELGEVVPPSAGAPARMRTRHFDAAFDLSLVKSSSRSAPRKAAPPPSPSTAEQSINQAGYELLEKLDEDGHGTLYKGRDRRKRLVLVRVLKNPVVFDDAAELAAVERALEGAEASGDRADLEARRALILGPGDRRGERIRG